MKPENPYCPSSFTDYFIIYVSADGTNAFASITSSSERR